MSSCRSSVAEHGWFKPEVSSWARLSTVADLFTLLYLHLNSFISSIRQDALSISLLMREWTTILAHMKGEQLSTELPFFAKIIHYQFWLTIFFFVLGNILPTTHMAVASSQKKHLQKLCCRATDTLIPSVYLLCVLKYTQSVIITLVWKCSSY